MKKTIITLASVALAATVYGQGQIEMNNRVITDAGRGTVNAPVFGPESDPFLAKTGGTATGDPAGTQTYGGTRLAGTGFTAELWFASGTGRAEADLQAATGRNTFRTGTGAGWMQPAVNTTLPGVTSGQVTLQLRVWDNMGGAITTWDQVLANDSILRGSSELFSPAAPVGFGTVLPPPLDNMLSFNIHQVVPEPSTIALAILGGLGTLLLLRRRK